MFSGYKETIILHLIQISFFAYPHYKKFVILSTLPLALLLLYALPTFTAVFRNQNWEGKKTKEQAGFQAYQTLIDDENESEINNNNQEFLSNRFSEIGMFTAYVKQIPDDHPYYGTEILENSVFALIPRILWPEKPNTEKLAMERVYQMGVVNRASVVSAKTRPVVDAYLIAGPAGVFIMMLIYGMLSQLLCNTAEKYFGGYQFGCAIVFNSLFQCLWRGNTFEFLINNILYGYILMGIIYWLFKKTRLLTHISTHENHTHYPIL